MFEPVTGEVTNPLDGEVLAYEIQFEDIKGGDQVWTCRLNAFREPPRVADRGQIDKAVRMSQQLVDDIVALALEKWRP